MRTTIALALLLLFSFLSACGKRYIPNTDVIDTPHNRSVVEFCEEYRRAVEKRNVGLLMSLAHPTYYEDGGNIDATDDIDYTGLREFLTTKFKDTRAIRYEIRYRRVDDGPGEKIFVDYTFSASYKLPTEEGEVWRREVSDNRLELLPVEDTYKILSGM